MKALSVVLFLSACVGSLPPEPPDLASTDLAGSDLLQSLACQQAGCSSNATCDESSGSPVCVCKTGFTGDGKTCTDINECLTNNGGCDVHATCANLDGARTCTCNQGYS